MSKFKEKIKIFEDGTQLSYLEKKSTQNTDKLLVIFPQGLRTADFFLNVYGQFKNIESHHIVILNPFGRKNSSDITDLKKKSNMSEVCSYYQKLISELGYPRENISLVAKSFTSQTLIKLLEFNQDYANFIIVAGPLYSPFQAKIIKYVSKLNLLSKVFRIITLGLAKFAQALTEIKFAYYDWTKKTGWYEFRNLGEEVLRKEDENIKISTRGYFILNGYDEIQNQEKIEHIKKKFINAEITFLDTKSHFGEVTDQELAVFFSTLDKFN